jgi:aminoglycoside N3'-acetyltransferase
MVRPQIARGCTCLHLGELAQVPFFVLVNETETCYRTGERLWGLFRYRQHSTVEEDYIDESSVGKEQNTEMRLGCVYLLTDFRMLSPREAPRTQQLLNLTALHEI